MSAITGDGAGRHDVVVDTRGAVLLDSTLAVVTELPGRDGTVVAIELSGRVNKTPTREDRLYLMDGAGAANLCAAVMDTFIRNGQGTEFLELVRVELDVAIKERS